MNAPAFARRMVQPVDGREFHVFVIAGEPSGDLLGAGLMRAIARRAGRVRFAGVGGSAMEREGLTSLLPLSDISVMGVVPVLRRLPQLMASIGRIADAVIAAQPDVLVIIDSPDFTHHVARRVRRVRLDLPIINYVGPSVWAWRSARARRMRGYIDHVLALLPFEPAEYTRLGGPGCTYVGHPLIEQKALLRPSADELPLRERASPTLLVMPGSRESEIQRLLPIFGQTLKRLNEAHSFEIILPTLPYLEELVQRKIRTWAVKPVIVAAPSDKHAAMRRARAALVASGTATLELALAGVPMVVAYRVSRLEEFVARRMLKIDKIALPNLILDRDAVPECVQADCSAEMLSEALAPLLSGGTQREGQLKAFDDLALRLNVDAREMPSDRAAKIVLRMAEGARSSAQEAA